LLSGPPDAALQIAVRFLHVGLRAVQRRDGPVMAAAVAYIWFEGLVGDTRALTFA